MAHTFADFDRELKRGKYNVSQYDLDLARRNPGAGISILNYKRDFMNATTPEARAMANKGAERIRSAYGNYTGGKDGSGYYLQNPTPMQWQAPAAPTYQNRYDDRIQNLLNEIQNRQSFSYNAETDDAYQQYKKQYTREGQRATADTLGTVAAASGGIPSSYATTAASQAGDYYASKMTDKIPELYQQAYDRYLNEYKQKMSTLGALQQAEQADYSKYLTGLNQHNTDRSFNYGQYLDNINHQRQLEQDNLAKAREFASVGDYSLYKDMGADIGNNPMERDRQWKEAMAAAQYGDLGRLRGMDVDTSNYEKQMEMQRQLEMARIAAANRSNRGSSGNGYGQSLALAKLAAEYGDYRGLNQLGIDTSKKEAELAEREQLEAEEKQADIILSKAKRGEAITPEEREILLRVYPEDVLEDMGINANISPGIGGFLKRLLGR